MQTELELKANIDRTQSRAQFMAAALETLRSHALQAGLSEDDIESQVEAHRLALEEQWHLANDPIQLPARNAYSSNGSESTMDATNDSNVITFRNLNVRYAEKLRHSNTILNDIFTFLNDPQYHQENLAMKTIKLRQGYTHTTAARAITYYRGANFNELCVFWCAARDPNITTSSVSNRTAAFIIALENAIRGNNRTFSRDDRDNGDADRPVCSTGLKNQLCLAMTSINNGYNAAHPDDVYVPVLRGATSEQISECMHRIFNAMFSRQSPENQAVLRAQSKHDEERNLKREQLICWTKFRDELVETSLNTLFTAYGKPDIEHQTRMRRACEDSCAQLRQYGDYDAPKQVDKKEDKEIIETEVEIAYDRILTEAALLLSSRSLTPGRKFDIRREIKAFDVEVLKSWLRASTVDEVVRRFFMDLGVTLLPTDMPPSSGARPAPALVPQAQAEAARQRQQVREGLTREVTEHDVNPPSGNFDRALFASNLYSHVMMHFARQPLPSTPAIVSQVQVAEDFTARAGSQASIPQASVQQPVVARLVPAVVPQVQADAEARRAQKAANLAKAAEYKRNRR